MLTSGERRSLVIGSYFVRLSELSQLYGDRRAGLGYH